MKKLIAAGLSVVAGVLALTWWNNRKTVPASSSTPQQGSPLSPPQINVMGILYWRSDLATATLQQVFKNKYQSDTAYHDPVQHFYLAADSRLDPKNTGPIQAGNAIIQSGYAKYILSDVNGTEIWVVDQTNTTLLAGATQSTFAVIAGPGQAQAILGSDPAYQLTSVKSSSVGAGYHPPHDKSAYRSGMLTGRTDRRAGHPSRYHDIIRHPHFNRDYADGYQRGFVTALEKS
jgi:hypothetical protein